MYPVLLEFGPITIHSFGAMVALAFLAGLYVIKKELQRRGIDPELGSSVVTAAMVGGLVGAKLYFVLFETPEGLGGWELLRSLFSGSGLTFYGGFIVSAAAVVWVIRRRQVPVLPVADAIGIGAALGYALGRIGCQLAGDGDYGVPTELPWGMAYPDGVVPTLEIVHPTPVYETLAGLAICSILWFGRTRIETPGVLLCIYLVLSGAARFAVEFIRINQKVLWGLSDAQLISLVMIAVGLLLGYWLLDRAARSGPA